MGGKYITLGITTYGEGVNGFHIYRRTSAQCFQLKAVSTLFQDIYERLYKYGLLRTSVDREESALRAAEGLYVGPLFETAVVPAQPRAHTFVLSCQRNNCRRKPTVWGRLNKDSEVAMYCCRDCVEALSKDKPPEHSSACDCRNKDIVESRRKHASVSDSTSTVFYEKHEAERSATVPPQKAQHASIERPSASHSDQGDTVSQDPRTTLAVQRAKSEGAERTSDAPFADKPRFMPSNDGEQPVKRNADPPRLPKDPGHQGLSPKEEPELERTPSPVSWRARSKEAHTLLRTKRPHASLSPTSGPPLNPPVHWVYLAKDRDPDYFTHVTIDSWRLPITRADYVTFPMSFKHLLYTWKFIEKGDAFRQLEEQLEKEAGYRSPPEHDIDCLHAHRSSTYFCPTHFHQTLTGPAPPAHHACCQPRHLTSKITRPPTMASPRVLHGLPADPDEDDPDPHRRPGIEKSSTLMPRG